MSHQPPGPRYIEIGVPGLEQAKQFYQTDAGLTLLPDADPPEFDAGQLRLRLIEDKTKPEPRLVTLAVPDPTKARSFFRRTHFVETGDRFILPSGIVLSLSAPETPRRDFFEWLSLPWPRIEDSKKQRRLAEKIIKVALDMEETMSVGGANAFNLWKHYQDRADRIKTHLWTTGTWLLAIIMAILAVPFTSELITIGDSYWSLDVAKAAPVTVLSIVGLLLCAYSLYVVKDLRDHIAENWARAEYLKKHEITRIGLTGTPRRIVLLLCLLIGALAVAFFCILVIIVIDRFAASAETVQLISLPSQVSSLQV